MVRPDVPESVDTFVAMLRGINVGGKHVLPMKDLVAMFRKAGGSDPRAYIQSGNVVFRASPRAAGRVPGLVETAIANQFGFPARVVLRTVKEFDAVATHNPFVQVDSDTGKLHVAFLADIPSPELVAALDPNRLAPDEFAIRGRDIYLRLPNGVARTKLTNQYFDTRLFTTSTLRNWKTVLKLLELARA